MDQNKIDNLLKLRETLLKCIEKTELEMNNTELEFLQLASFASQVAPKLNLDREKRFPVEENAEEINAIPLQLDFANTNLETESEVESD